MKGVRGLDGGPAKTTTVKLLRNDYGHIPAGTPFVLVGKTASGQPIGAPVGTVKDAGEAEIIAPKQIEAAPSEPERSNP